MTTYKAKYNKFCAKCGNALMIPTWKTCNECSKYKPKPKKPKMYKDYLKEQKIKYILVD
jgi:DNA-directed RNA polymerase subunit M/transcription elongation factor TFIIS